jgi:small multidrug resistance family-3 protein
LFNLRRFNVKNNAAFLCHRAVRNHRLLFTLALVKTRGDALLLMPAALALALFVWLLTLHPEASGRVYAAYGGVYVCTALLWLRFIDGVKLSHYDWAGALVALCGMLIIVAGWGRA